MMIEAEERAENMQAEGGEEWEGARWINGTEAPEAKVTLQKLIAGSRQAERGAGEQL